MFKNLFKNKFAINKVKDPAFPFKKSLFPLIIMTSDKIMQIFKSLRVARVLLCLGKKFCLNILQSERYIRLYSQENMANGTLLIRTTKF